MGVLFMASASIGDLSQWNGVTNASVSTEAARTGTSSFKLTSTTGILSRSIPNKSTLYTKAGNLFASNADNTYKIRYLETSTIHLTLRFNTMSGTVSAWRADNVLLGEAWANIVAGRWFCIEAKVVIHDTTGSVEVKVNGQVKLLLSGVDTRNAGTGVINTVQWHHYNAGSAITEYVDDIVIRDDDWQGMGGLLLLAPNAAGDVSGWTASVGQPYECVDETPPSFTDYISTDAGTPGTIHLFNLGDLPVSTEAIKSVGVFARAKLSGVGTGGLRVKIKAGSTVADGDDFSFGSIDPQWVNGYWDNNPDDSAPFETADINALQIGVETR